MGTFTGKNGEMQCKQEYAVSTSFHETLQLPSLPPHPQFPSFLHTFTLTPLIHWSLVGTFLHYFDEQFRVHFLYRKPSTELWQEITWLGCDLRAALHVGTLGGRYHGRRQDSHPSRGCATPLGNTTVHGIEWSAHTRHHCLHERVFVLCAGVVAYQIEQEFGVWHVWVPTKELGCLGCTADALIVHITASELQAGASGSSAPYLKVLGNALFPLPPSTYLQCLQHYHRADVVMRTSGARRGSCGGRQTHHAACGSLRMMRCIWSL